MLKKKKKKKKKKRELKAFSFTGQFCSHVRLGCVNGSFIETRHGGSCRMGQLRYRPLFVSH